MWHLYALVSYMYPFSQPALIPSDPVDHKKPPNAWSWCQPFISSLIIKTGLSFFFFLIYIHVNICLYRHVYTPVMVFFASRPHNLSHSNLMNIWRVWHHTGEILGTDVYYVVEASWAGKSSVCSQRKVLGSLLIRALICMTFAVLQ